MSQLDTNPAHSAPLNTTEKQPYSAPNLTLLSTDGTESAVSVGPEDGTNFGS